MAKGETTFSTGKVEKKRYAFTPIKAGDYELKILGDSAEVRTAEPSKKNPNPMPRVNFAVEALGSGEDGGSNRKVFHTLWCSLKADKNGVVGPARADQLKGLADALGKDANIAIKTIKGQECLDPIALKKWLEKQDGEVVKGHVRIQKGTAEYPQDRNVISEFFEPEESEKEDEDEAEEDEDLDEGDDVDEDEDEDEDEDDDLPPAKSVKKGKKSKR
jgi:hypothetical protein